MLIPDTQQMWAARRLISRHLPPSPLVHSQPLSALCEGKVFFKVESLQPTGSFKIRGALNRLSAPGAPRAVVTSSSGNHGGALAMIGGRLGIEVTVVVPRPTPEAKKARARSLGARVIVVGDVYDEAEIRAREMAQARGVEYISGFEDALVVAGASTIAHEILEWESPPGTLLVPVGGGGLITGITAALENLSPGTAVVGVQPEASAPMALSLAAGHMVEATHAPTLSEGTAGGISAGLFEYLRHRVAEVITVREDEIARAIRHLALRERVIAEGAGALPTAALIARGSRTPWQFPIVALVSGGNIDPAALSRVIAGTDSTGSAP